MAQTQYCTRIDMSDVLSFAGVNLRLDDAPPGGISQVIDRASLEVDEYCLQRYGSRLADSLWVAKRCAEIACYFLSVRRGNPAPSGVAQLYERAVAKLEQVRRGDLKIPNLVESKSCHPRMSNIRATLRPFPHTVVERARTTGTPADYHQNRDPWDSFGLNGSWIMDYSF